MRTKLFMAAIAATFLSLISCQDEDQTDKIEISKYINIEANMQPLSRIIENSFDMGDEVSVYGWTGDMNVVPADLVVNNSINTKGADAWSATPMMLWADMATDHYFLGVHPTKAITNFTADLYDQAIDVLVAVNQEGRKAEGSNGGIVPLIFDHVMGRLDVNLTFRNEFEGNAMVGAITANAMPGATVNYLAKDAQAAGTPTDIALATLTANKLYSLVLGIQKIHKIDITVNGKVYTYNNTEGVDLVKGKVQKVNLIVGRDQIVLGAVSINPWEDADGSIDGEAQEDE